MSATDDKTPERKAQRPVKDVRGRSVTLLDPYSLHLLRRHDVIPAEPLRRIAEEIGSGLPKETRGFLYVFVPALIFATIVFLIRVGDLTLSGRLIDIFDRHSVLLLSVWPWALFFWLTAKRRRWGRIRRAMLRHLRCPHCGYDMRGLPTAPEDGATICPECGCAWRLDAAHRDNSRAGVGSDIRASGAPRTLETNDHG